jgi:hypothetical protein
VSRTHFCVAVFSTYRFHNVPSIPFVSGRLTLDHARAVDPRPSPEHGPGGRFAPATGAGVALTGAPRGAGGSRMFVRRNPEPAL